MVINSTKWELDPHTEAKHKILKRYVDAWLPIITKIDKRVVYIDAFSGPGIYSKGELGSPMIVLDSVIKHNTKNKFEFVSLFIDKDKDRCECLKNIIDELNLPDKIRNPEIVNGDANSVLDNALTDIESKNIKLAPTLAFIDPFNYDVSFEVIRRLFRNNKCEILVSFMYSGIIRNIPNDIEAQKLDRFFGTRNWRESNDFDSKSKKQFLHNLYFKQLEGLEREKNDNETLVRSFEMIDKQNKTAYFLFYMTKNLLGLEKMKEAMWKVDNTGNFRFSDTTNPNQTVLFTLDETDKLKRQMKEEFLGKTVYIDNIEDFVIKRTAFLRSHIRDKLIELEKNGEITVTRDSRSYTYPPGSRTKITFIE